MEAVKSRGENYGSPKENMQRIADYWNVYLRHCGVIVDASYELGPEHVAMMNDLQKTARLVETPDHADSIVDKAGYSAVYAECVK